MTLQNPRLRSVLQDWVMELPLREQGTLLTCVRGCDVTPKLPLDSIERQLVGALRFAFLEPADLREVDKEPGCFFVSRPPYRWRASELGHYPLHWYSHIMHSAEVIAYRHPDDETREQWMQVYVKLATALHLTPETFDEFVARLSEDRIASGEVVS